MANCQFNSIRGGAWNVNGAKTLHVRYGWILPPEVYDPANGFRCFSGWIVELETGSSEFSQGTTDTFSEGDGASNGVPFYGIRNVD